VSELDALLLSLVIEVPIACALASTLQSETSRRRVAVVAILATCFTHAFVWNLGTTWPRIIALEIAAAAVESLFYLWAAGMRTRDAFVLGVVTNACSFGVGLVSFAVLRSL
jgi:hypothetical protein